MSMGAFGVGSMYMEKRDDNRGIIYKSEFIGNIFIDEGKDGFVNKVIRKVQWNAEQIMEEFEDERIPQKVHTARKSNPNKKFDIIQVVEPNKNFDRTRSRITTNKPFNSTWVLVEDKEVLREGGFNTFPFAIDRYTKGAGEIYARSPAMTVLPDIKMVDAMSKTTIEEAQKIANPALLLQEDGALTEVQAMPGALNYGGLDENGNPLVKPLNTNSNISVSMEMIAQRQSVIKEAFFVNLFQILVDSPQMTATEVIERVREKGALLSPTMGRLQSESLGPQIEREIDILSSIGALPPMPQELIEAGGQYEIIYDSPLSRAQRAEEVSGILRTFETISPFAQVDPTIYDNFDGNEITRIAAEVHGMPVKALRSEEAVTKIRTERIQSQQQQEQVEGMGSVTGAIKDIAQAQKLQSES